VRRRREVHGPKTSSHAKLQKRAERLVPGRALHFRFVRFALSAAIRFYIGRGQGSSHNIGTQTARICRLHGLLGTALSATPHPQSSTPISLRAMAPASARQLLPKRSCRIVISFPTWQTVRFVSSGDEAAMSAIRLARAYTNANNIVSSKADITGPRRRAIVQAWVGRCDTRHSRLGGASKSSRNSRSLCTYNDICALDQASKKSNTRSHVYRGKPVVANPGMRFAARGYLESTARPLRRTIKHC